MCFHYNLHQPADKLKNRFTARIKNYKSPTNPPFNGFTYPQAPVILDEEPQLIQPAIWGLIPVWSKDRNIQKYTLNAKIETLTEKPSFRNSVNKRCLILADSFYEWQWLDPKGKNKQKYEIRKAKEELFSFGGIWSEWTDRKTGEIVKSYSIVTTVANEFMAQIHNSKKRMPVLLNQAEEATWLKGGDLHLFKKREVDLKAMEVS